MNRFIWQFLTVNEEYIRQLQQQFNIDASLVALLVQRNILSLQEANTFFVPEADSITQNPYLMCDMNKAVNRILQAIHNTEKILIYGDYDVDGVASVALLLKFLKNTLSAKNIIDTYIPDRNIEGYGITEKGYQHILNYQYSLLITVDCGTSENQRIESLKQNNIDTIVCDHHAIGHELTQAAAFLNPHRTNCTYPFKDFCACGIVFKLVLAISQQLSLNITDIFDQYIDMVALATVADMVPLINENRFLVIEGLKKINHYPSIPIQAIKDVYKLSSPVDSDTIAYHFAPLINAAGRMHHAQVALELLLTTDPTQAKHKVSQLQEYNQQRKLLDKKIIEEVLQSNQIIEDKFTIVVYNPNWRKGVLGIAAAQLTQKFYKPTVVLTLQDGLWTGSARSIEGVNLHNILIQCGNLLQHFGGHYFAAGLSLMEESLTSFIDQFEILTKKILHDQQPTPFLKIHATIYFNQITLNFYNFIQRIQPFGNNNPEPIFCTNNVTLHSVPAYLKDIHGSCIWANNGVAFKGVLFNHAPTYFPLLQLGKQYDIAYNIRLNTWNNIATLQLHIIDIQESAQRNN